MRQLLPFIAILFGWSLSYGQDPKALEKIESAKIALITERLSLTPEQAEKFWPVYREYSERQLAMRREFQDARKSYDPKTASDEESQRLLDLGMRIKERQLQMEKDYSERLLLVINQRQLLSLRKAEEDFRAMLLVRLQQQRDRQQQLREGQQQNPNLQQRRRIGN